MTDIECINHLEKLKLGIQFMNDILPDEDKDNIDIEALTYAITRLKENKE